MSIPMNSMYKFGIGGVLFGAISFGYSVYQAVQLKKTGDKIGMTIDELSKKTAVDIESSILDKAIERAVDRQVSKAVSDTVRDIKDDMHRQIKEAVRKEVEAQYKHISDEVSDEISKQVADINDELLRDKVMKRAEDILVKRHEKDTQAMQSDYMRGLRQNIEMVKGMSDLVTSFMPSNNNNGQGLKLTLG